MIDIMVTLTLGSLDTLKSQLGWCFYHLATHPQDRDAPGRRPRPGAKLRSRSSCVPTP